MKIMFVTNARDMIILIDTMFSNKIIRVICAICGYNFVPNESNSC
jgi:hypothetical protein